MERNDSFSRLDRALVAAHRFFIVRHPVFAIFLSCAFYLSVLLAFGTLLGISSNYFVLLPVFSFALVFGFPGGIVAGSLALPANLLLFSIIGHPEYSPESKTIAEISGVFVGAAFGYLSDYFRKLNNEVERRARVEEELRKGYAEKDMLLRELQHRVKNNLNMLKGFIQLQRNRSEDPEFREATGLLLNRVYAVALAHDTLFEGGMPIAASGGEAVDAETYLRSVAENVSIAYPDVPVQVSVAVEPSGSRLEKTVALSLGLVVNELAVNAAKHAFPGDGSPLFSVRLSLGPERWTLSVRDNGKGFEAAAGRQEPGIGRGLGLAIIDSVCSRLGGAAEWSNDGGLVFELSFPPIV